jgi:UDP-N-acetylglucosamine transferase subunit ALG13
MTETVEPFIFVSAGTDHHPFDRLIDWSERWLSERPVSCLIQVGTSRPPVRGRWVDYLPHQEVERAVGAATAVVCHGGPGTITLALHFGTRPIVVPRQQALGEHVDDHQMLFARRLAAAGEIDLAETEESFREALDTAVGHSRPAPRARRPRTTDATVRRFTELVDEMMAVAGRRYGSAWPARRRDRGRSS